MGEGTFTFILRNGNKVSYDNWYKIPKDLDLAHVIQFKPNIPPPPHTLQQHQEINDWGAKFNQLMELSLIHI